MQTKILNILLFLMKLSTSRGQIKDVYCYQCSGIACEPVPEYLKACDNLIGRQVARCFSVAWNMSNIYRGCFEEVDDNIGHCRTHQLTKCTVCDGNGCNNAPLFSNQTISCRICAVGQCSSLLEQRIDLHTCPRFLMGITPSCYVILYYKTFEYSFGCGNRMTEFEAEFCRVETFGLSCYTCTTTNCNTFHFEYGGSQDNDRSICYASHFSPDQKYWCDITTFETIYAQCITEMNVFKPRTLLYAGCTNYLLKQDSEYMTRSNDMYFCIKKGCNRVPEIRRQIRENSNRQCYFNQFPVNRTYCALDDSCCMVAEYKDERDLVQKLVGCETWVKCSQAAFCRRCCGDKYNLFVYRDREPCNSEPDKFTHQCYRCSYCSLVHDQVLANQTMCMAERGQPRECYTYVGGGLVWRGCYEKGANYSQGLAMCARFPSHCYVCEGALCNNRNVIMYCYICESYNHQCVYHQEASYLQMCPYTPDVIKELGCYSIVDAFGSVERGCYQEEFNCPAGAKECHTCTEPGCNIEAYYFDECYECKATSPSAAYSECATSPATLVRCPVTMNRPLCYISYSKSSQGVLGIERGCSYYTYYEEILLNKCVREVNSTSSECYFCDTSKCNYFTRKKKWF